MGRKIKLEEANRSFDLAFWKRVGVKGRFEALWQMVKEANMIKGKDGHQLRLQRSVQNIKHL